MLLALASPMWAAAASMEHGGTGLLDPGAFTTLRRVKAMPAVPRVVFLHVEETGGTSFTSWIAKLHAVCARHATEKEAEAHYGRYITNETYKDLVNPAARDDEVDEATLATCGPAAKVCSLTLRDEWSNHECEGEIQRFVDAGCTFVELHHYDLAVANAFRNHGYATMTFLREPAVRIASEMMKYLEKKSLDQVLEDPTSRPDRPDKSIKLLTACTDHTVLTSRGPSSCTPEFLLSDTPELRNITHSIDENLAGARCPDDKNVTEHEYAKLYEAATKNVHDFDFVGVLERFDLMTKVWAKRFSVTSELPQLVHVKPHVGSDRGPQDYEPDLPSLRQHLSYDGKLWCGMSASLTDLAKELDVDMSEDSEDQAAVDKRCLESYLDPPPPMPPSPPPAPLLSPSPALLAPYIPHPASHTHSSPAPSPPTSPSASPSTSPVPSPPPSPPHSPHLPPPAVLAPSSPAPSSPAPSSPAPASPPNATRTWANNARDVQELFTFLDADKSGGISLQELVQACNGVPGLPEAATLGLLFQDADSDGDGELDPYEFVAIVTAAGLKSERDHSMALLMKTFGAFVEARKRRDAAFAFGNETAADVSDVSDVS